MRFLVLFNLYFLLIILFILIELRFNRLNEYIINRLSFIFLFINFIQALIY